MLHMISPWVEELYIGPLSWGEMAKLYDTNAVRAWLQQARDSNAFLTVLSRFPSLTKLTFKADTGIVALFAQAILAGQCSSKIEELDIAGYYKSMDGDNGWHHDEIRQLEATGDPHPPIFRLSCLHTFVRALSSDHLPSLRRLKLEKMDVRAADGGPCALLQIFEGRHAKGFPGLEEIPLIPYIPESQLSRTVGTQLRRLVTDTILLGIHVTLRLLPVSCRITPRSPWRSFISERQTKRRCAPCWRPSLGQIACRVSMTLISIRSA
jgi:hypothetical protein